MANKLVNVGSVVGKDILNLEDGSFLGKVQNILVDGTAKTVVGIQVKQKGLLGSKNRIPFEQVRSFGSHTVTISNTESSAVVEGRNILNMSIISVDGTILGKVYDYAFSPTDGVIAEFVLKGGLVDDVLGEKGVIDGNKILSIGKDVIVAMEDVGTEDFKSLEEDIYLDWKDVDQILEDIYEDEEEATDQASQETTKKETSYESQFNELTSVIHKALNDVGGIIKEIDKEKIKVQADKFGDEAKGLFGSIKEKIQQSKLGSMDIETIKQDLLNMTQQKKEEGENTTLAMQIVEQLKGATVEKPLLDNEGNVIVWPGQIIGEAEVKEAILNGKLQDLIHLTVVMAENEEKTSSSEEGIDNNMVEDKDNEEGALPSDQK